MPADTAYTSVLLSTLGAFSRPQWRRGDLMLAICILFACMTNAAVARSATLSTSTAITTDQLFPAPAMGRGLLQHIQQDGEAPNVRPPAQPDGDLEGGADKGANAPKKPYQEAFEGGFPKTPKQRAKVLSNLYAYLATVGDAETANEIANVIERLWLMSGSDTIAVLMERSLRAVSEKNIDLALKLLDAVVELAPDYAEGWNRRAFVYYLMEDRTRAAGDLRRVLALEPNHFKAMQGLAQILKDAEQKKGALEAYRKLLEIHPYADGAQDAVRELETEIEGQGI